MGLTSHARDPIVIVSLRETPLVFKAEAYAS